MSTSNPFAALIFNENEKSTSSNLNDTLQQIFKFTLNPSHENSSELLYLEDVRNVHEKSELDMNLLQYALFERLFMCNDNSALRNVQIDSPAFETRVIKYLYTCLKNLNTFKTDFIKNYENEVRDKIIQNVATAIIQPDIYSGQNIPAEFVEILKEADPEAVPFFIESSKRVVDEDNGNKESLRNFIVSMNKIVVDDLTKSSLTNYDLNIFNYLHAMTINEIVGELFIDSIMLKETSVGSEYSVTLVGALLNLSILPKLPGGPYEHFLEPMDRVANSGMEAYLWNYLEKLNQNLHQFILSMLKCSPKVKNKTLTWLGDCLRRNCHRGKIWNMHTPELNPAVYTNVTDGFMLNMSNLMLSLCQPFCTKVKDGKILKVDPTYCAVSNEKADDKNVHLKDLSKETCFLPVAVLEDNEEERLTADNYNFLTECFYMAHKAVDLGYRVAVEKLIRQNHEIGRIERAFNDALQQAGGNSDLVGTIKDRLREELTKYLSLKCTLSNPDILQKMFDLVSATCYWLCQVSLHNDFKNSETYAPSKEIALDFPISGKIPDTLKCIPEFLVENVVFYLVFLSKFSTKSFEEQGYEKLNPILSFVLIYMGSQCHLKNPHMRARLAEGLESLLPFQKGEQPGNILGGTQRQKLFTEHPHRLHIVRNLMDVFVSIEMTGQSVEFEQKFNYRRPMYLVFDYLWELPEHRNCFMLLAIEAEKNMEAVNPPLFLSFANLLINDAIFLLDESLANMAKLKEMQQAQDNGDWNNLNVRERTQNISYMHHIGNMARFDNILGKDTIGTLEKLTSKIDLVFTHSTMVDRIAAMLNYFLLNLVGPNKKNFKVKDAKEYQFDPAAMVLEICKIYVNLKENESFCLAISQDGRSYSPNLFTLAEDILIRIGGGTLIGELKELAEKVAQKAREQEASEEALSEAPEHFLDPIMSTLMTDPVILPSSRQTVDRSTIARHLLSDQTDPFNRSPLSMDQVIPNVELAEEINKWKAERTGV